MSRNLNKSCRRVLWNTWPMSQEAEADLYRSVNQFSVTCDILIDSWTHESMCGSSWEHWSVSPYGSLTFSPSSQEVWQYTFVPTHTKGKSTRGIGPGIQIPDYITWHLISALFTKISTHTYKGETYKKKRFGNTTMKCKKKPGLYHMTSNLAIIH